MPKPSESTSEGDPRRKSLKRIVLVAAGVIVALVVVLVVAVVLIVDPERFKPRIETALEDATGWSAELGEIDLSILSGLALRIEPARLASPQPDGSHLEIGAISVDAQILPLLRGQLIVDAVVLQDPDVLLVREPDGTWQIPAMGGEAEPAEPSTGDPGARDGGSDGAGVEIRVVRITDGNVKVVDRTVSPPREIPLTSVDVDTVVETGRVEARGELLGAPFTIVRVVGDPIEASVEDMPMPALAPFVGEGLFHEGGTLSLDVSIDGAGTVAGSLDGRALGLAGAPDPLEEVAGSFRVAPASEGMRLDELTLEAGATRLTGEGSLTPSLDVTLSSDEMPLDQAKRFLSAFAELPVELEPPGRFDARVHLAEGPSGFGFEVTGGMSAAVLRAGGPVPEIRDVEASYRLVGVERLTIEIAGGRVAEGALDGVIALAPVVPPGTLTFDGSVEEAVFGHLLAGALGEKVSRLVGPTGLVADLGVDLSRGTLGPQALTGRASFDAIEVAVPGLDLERKLRSALRDKLGSLGDLATLLGDDAPDFLREPDGQPDPTEQVVDALSGQIRFDGSEWPIADLMLETGDVAAYGSGKLDWSGALLDLALTARLSAEETSKLVGEYGFLKNAVDDDGRLTVPLTIGGELTDPSVKMDLGGVVAPSGKDKLIEGLFDKLR